jgi:hypothetical protein
MAEQAGAVNAYFCRKCRRFTGTVCLATGVTPGLIGCLHCGKDLAGSVQYQLGPFLAELQCPFVRVTHAWYRPRVDEHAILRRTNAPSAEHVARGGLLLAPLRRAIELNVSQELDPVDDDDDDDEKVRKLRSMYGGSDVVVPSDQ